MIKLSSLSKSEYKHRMKFIQEWNYNKEEQKIFDEAKARRGISYKELYRNMRNGGFYMFMGVITARRMNEAVANLGSCAIKMTDSFVELGKMCSIVLEGEI